MLLLFQHTSRVGIAFLFGPARQGNHPRAFLWKLHGLAFLFGLRHHLYLLQNVKPLISTRVPDLFELLKHVTERRKIIACQSSPPSSPKAHSSLFRICITSYNSQVPYYDGTYWKWQNMITSYQTIHLQVQQAKILPMISSYQWFDLDHLNAPINGLWK